MRGYGYGFVDGNGMMGGNWFGALAMGLLWLLVIVGIVFMIVRMVRRGGHGPMMMHGMQHGGMADSTPAVPAHDEAVAIARKRFASGEITKEQFDELMSSLG